MKVIKNSQFSKINNKPVALAIGSFDGVHKGHQHIINKCLKIADKRNLVSGVFSFTPHPLRVLDSKREPEYLISENQKIEKLKDLDIDYYFQQKFTKDFARIKFKEFIKNILIDKLKTKYLVVGKDFQFGYKGRGDVETLKKLSSDYDYQVTVVSPVKIKNKIVSSSYIRKLVKEGSIEKILEFLGDNFKIEGKVIKGKGIGRKLGFPTANLKLKVNYVLPPPGVYAGYVEYNDNRYKAIGNFGYNPTFSEDKYQIEIHILDFSKNIYEETLSFKLVEFIREEEYFDDLSKLKEQINKDILYTQKHLC